LREFYLSFDIVTGAFGYIGRYIAQRLLSIDRSVTTLTGHPARQNPFGGKVQIASFNFDRPDDLARSLHRKMQNRGYGVFRSHG
jgi:NADH dehydrogenase